MSKSYDDITKFLDKIENFNLHNIKNSNINIIGKRGSGKTWMIIYLLYHLQKNNQIDECVIISPTEKCNPFYTNYVNGKIYYKFDENILINLIVLQVMRQCKNHVVLVLDDCFRAPLKNIPSLTNIFNTIGQYNITVIWIMQYPYYLKDFKKKFNYTFLLSDDFISNINRLYRHYAKKIFPNEYIFRKVFQEMTKDHNAMCIMNNNDKQDKTIFELITKLEATPVIDFKIKSSPIKYNDDIEV